MKDIRLYSAIFIVILTIFLTLEHFGLMPLYGFSIDPMVYFLGVSAVLFQILFGRVLKLSVYVPLISSFIVYCICKSIFVGAVDLTQGSQVVIVFIEITLLLGVTWGGNLYAAAIHDSEDMLQEFLFAQDGGRLKRVEQERKKIEIEIDRSRRFNRPLSIIVFKPEEAFFNQAIRPVLLNVHKYITKEFLIDKLGNFLGQNTRSHDFVVTYNNKDGLLLICPETPIHGAQVLLEKLKEEAREQFGVDLACGTATFPDEVITFDELLAKAELSVDRQKEFVRGLGQFKN